MSKKESNPPPPDNAIRPDPPPGPPKKIATKDRHCTDCGHPLAITDIGGGILVCPRCVSIRCDEAEKELTKRKGHMQIGTLEVAMAGAYDRSVLDDSVEGHKANGYVCHGNSFKILREPEDDYPYGTHNFWQIMVKSVEVIEVDAGNLFAYPPTGKHPPPQCPPNPLHREGYGGPVCPDCGSDFPRRYLFQKRRCIRKGCIRSYPPTGRGE